MKPYFIIGLLSIVLFSCSSSDSVIETEPPPTPTEKLPINISTSVSSSAIDLAFEVGDSIGLYVVNHNADGSAAALQVSGNYVDNMQYTYNTLGLLLPRLIGLIIVHMQISICITHIHLLLPVLKLCHIALKLIRVSFQITSLVF